MGDPRIEAIAEWLIEGARSAPRSEDVLAELCPRLVAAGLDLWHVAIFVRTLHPQVMGRRFEWRAGTGVSVEEAPFAVRQTAEYRDSPVAAIYASGATLRRRLADGAGIEFPILAQLRAEGVTDYLALPLVFGDGAIHVATWTTRQQGGFDDREIAALESLGPPLARPAEIHALRRNAANLLDSYVGHQSGERILAGHIRARRLRGARRGDLALRYARLHHPRRQSAAADIARAALYATSYFSRFTLSMLVPSMRMRPVGPLRLGEWRSPSL